MANKKRNKYPNKSKVLADARRYVIKKGEYNGAEDSSEFMVSGHSSGSPYSEMEELSMQVTRDAGGYAYKEPEFANDQGETAYEMYQGEGVGDLGGPELYGDRYMPRASKSRGLAIGAAIGLAATAVLGGLAYYFYQNEQPVRRARGGKRAQANHRVAAGAHHRATSAAGAAPKRKAKSARSSRTASSAKSRSQASSKRASQSARA